MSDVDSGQSTTNRLEGHISVALVDQPDAFPKKIEISKTLNAGFASVAGVGLWLFLIGWIYADEYFRSLGIPFSSLELPIEYFPYYGIKRLSQSTFLLILIVGSVGLIFAASTVSVLTRHATLVAGGAGTLTALLLIWSVMSAGGIARSDVIQMKEQRFVGFDRANLHLAKDWMSADDSRRVTFETLVEKRGCGRILYQSANDIWVVIPRAQNTLLLAIPRESVKAITILGPRRNCGD